MDKIKERFMGWLKQPFKPEGDWIDWMLFAFLILIAAFMWSRIIGAIALPKIVE